MAKNLVVMCGIPGSGKSYIATEYFCNLFEDPAYISRDYIRFSLVGENEPYFKKENEVFKTFCAKINTYLNVGCTVIADATHLNPASRRKLLKEIDNKDEVNVIFCDVKAGITIPLQRNRRREGRKQVPEDVIRNMYNSFDPPVEEEATDLGFASGKVLTIDNRY